MGGKTCDCRADSDPMDLLCACTGQSTSFGGTGNGDGCSGYAERDVAMGTVCDCNSVEAATQGWAPCQQARDPATMSCPPGSR